MYSLGKMVVTATLKGGLRSIQTVDLQVRRWSPKDWRPGQAVDLKVCRWPPKEVGRGWAQQASHTRSTDRCNGGRQGLGLTRCEGGPSHNQAPGGRHRQPLPSHTSSL